MLNTCIQIAREAGQLILELSEKPRHIEKKAAFDLVTDADKASNDLICRRLMEAFPTSKILAEESTSPQPSPLNGEGVLWIVDPIDGTTNYARGMPHAAVSIGAYDLASQELLVGCVFNPFINECFWAAKGEGAYLNGERIHVSTINQLSDAVVATGFFNTGDLTFETSNLPEAYRFIQSCLGLRRAGAASLDLCWVAMGRLDMYWEKGLKAWDLAAGALIVQEAGGKLSNYQDEKLDIFQGTVLASNGHLHKTSIDILNNQ
ncbi:MAG: inositol monophosphatase family protein [Myxococcota bacterium]